jgi:hypothetical protein
LCVQRDPGGAVTRDELRAFDGADVAVLFMLVDEPDEAWTRTLHLYWQDDRPWIGDKAGKGWFLDEALFDRVRVIDDDLRDSLGRHVDGAQLFLALNVSNLPEGRAMTMTGLRIPRSERPTS